MEDLTHFASAQRSSAEEIRVTNQLVALQNIFTEIFGSIAGIGAVIDNNRQIVYTNNDFLSVLGIDSLESILGTRLGEVISCVHSMEEPGGCGTSQACAYCGAIRSILECQRTGRKSTKETRITTNEAGIQRSLDLNVTSTPLMLDGKMFYTVILQDISDQKRRQALEQIFFHDLMNSAGALNGLLTLLKEGSAPDLETELINLSEEASRDIIEEITLHRHIRSAEKGDLQVKREKCNSVDILKDAIGKIAFHDAGKNRQIIIADGSVNTDFESDRILLQRVIINLLKNALEATRSDGYVTAGVESHADIIRFWVKNEEIIPAEVQMQLFQRSFSTKGQNRGIGLYSVRLLTENYLNGKISFSSNENEGTLFRIEIKKL